jgi:hypothetical protein
MFATASAIAFDYNLLSNDATLQGLVTGGWHLDQAPAGTVEPYGVIHQQSAPDMRTMNAFLMHTDPLITIRVIGSQTLYPTLLQAAQRVDALLGRTSGVAPDGQTITACYRENELNIPELVSGVIKSAVGGTYRHIVTT